MDYFTVSVKECRVSMIKQGHVKILAKFTGCVLVVVLPEGREVEINVKDLLSFRRSMTGLKDWEIIRNHAPKEVEVAVMPTGRVKVHPGCLNIWMNRAFPPKKGFRLNGGPKFKRKRGYLNTGAWSGHKKNKRHSKKSGE